MKPGGNKNNVINHHILRMYGFKSTRILSYKMLRNILIGDAALRLNSETYFKPCRHGHSGEFVWGRKDSADEISLYKVLRTCKGAELKLLCKLDSDQWHAPNPVYIDNNPWYLTNSKVLKRLDPYIITMEGSNDVYILSSINGDVLAHERFNSVSPIKSASVSVDYECGRAIFLCRLSKHYLIYVFDLFPFKRKAVIKTTCNSLPKRDSMMYGNGARIIEASTVLGIATTRSYVLFYDLQTFINKLSVLSPTSDDEHNFVDDGRYAIEFEYGMPVLAVPTENDVLSVDHLAVILENCSRINVCSLSQVIDQMRTIYDVHQSPMKPKKSVICDLLRPTPILQFETSPNAPELHGGFLYDDSQRLYTKSCTSFTIFEANLNENPSGVNLSPIKYEKKLNIQTYNESKTKENVETRYGRFVRLSASYLYALNREGDKVHIDTCFQLNLIFILITSEENIGNRRVYVGDSMGEKGCVTLKYLRLYDAYDYTLLRTIYLDVQLRDVSINKISFEMNEDMLCVSVPPKFLVFTIGPPYPADCLAAP